jgi:hypothetical protein
MDNLAVQRLKRRATTSYDRKAIFTACRAAMVGSFEEGIYF